MAKAGSHPYHWWHQEGHLAITAHMQQISPALCIGMSAHLWHNFKFSPPLPVENTIWAPCRGNVLGPSANISYSQRQSAPLTLHPRTAGLWGCSYTAATRLHNKEVHNVKKASHE